MLDANVPTRFWPHATADFVHKKNYLWYSEDTSGKWSTSHDRIQPAFAGTRDTVAIPFGSRVVSTLPREHRRVVNGSFGDRFVEGIYLHANSQTPTIRMFDLASRTERSVKISSLLLTNYPTCLTRSPDTLRKELTKMLAEDEADDQLIADQLKTQVITRSQSQAAERAQQNELIPSATRQKAGTKPSSKKGPKVVPAPKQQNAETSYLDTTMSEMQELALAHAFVTHKIPVTLPAHYNPAGMTNPKGDMVVIVVKAQRQTRDRPQYG
jgi:hypothetical protein